MKAFRMFSFPSIAIFSFSFLPLTISLIYILNITLDFPFMWLCLKLPNTSFLLLLSVGAPHEGLFSCFVGSLPLSLPSESLFNLVLSTYPQPGFCLLVALLEKRLMTQYVVLMSSVHCSRPVLLSCGSSDFLWGNLAESYGGDWGCGDLKGFLF